MFYQIPLDFLFKRTLQNFDRWTILFYLFLLFFLIVVTFVFSIPIIIYNNRIVFWTCIKKRNFINSFLETEARDIFQFSFKEETFIEFIYYLFLSRVRSWRFVELRLGG